MTQNPPEGGRLGGPRPERLPHHISSIAHLFFDDDEGSVRPTGPVTVRSITVTGFNDSRISAYACASLVTATRVLATGGDARGVRLEEDPAVPWSAKSFLARGPSANGESSEKGGTGTIIWNWPADVAEPDSAPLVRWVHLQAVGSESLAALEMRAGNGRNPLARARGRGDLVVCLLAREMGCLGPAFRLGRLMGLLAPRRLEILVFPDFWATGGAAVPGTGQRDDRGDGVSEDLLKRCRSLTRAVAGACPVSITVFPAGESGNPDRSPGMILQKLAARLAVD